MPLHFSPRRHAVVWLFLALVFLVLAGGAYYWNEGVQYRTYLVIAAVIAVLGLVPLFLQTLFGRGK